MRVQEHGPRTHLYSYKIHLKIYIQIMLFLLKLQFSFAKNRLFEAGCGSSVDFLNPKWPPKMARKCSEICKQIKQNNENSLKFIAKTRFWEHEGPRRVSKTKYWKLDKKWNRTWNCIRWTEMGMENANIVNCRCRCRYKSCHINKRKEYLCVLGCKSI